MTDHLRFSTEMLRRLGEELNPHPDQGILELVRNAYDADATECRVELVNTQQGGGTVRVSDNGNGMTVDSIRQGWLVLGRSDKATLQKTGRGRIPIGNKGIGRLSALRMGSSASLTTRPKVAPSQEHHLAIDWTAFDKATMVDEVPLEIKTYPRAAGAGKGTVIEINKLNKRLVKADVKRLARALVLLADPFRDDNTSEGGNNFRPVLHSQEFEELEQLVARGYRDEADFFLRAELDAKGRAKAVVRSYDGQELFKSSHQELSAAAGCPLYSAPAAVFELWWFVLGGANFSPRSVTLPAVREWLRVFGGVHLYHRGMRVSPYSDYDWLDMNLRRVRSPEVRPSTNNSIGRFAVPDESGQLKPKTDRLGFIEDSTFHSLRQFASDVLEWLADRMLKRREEQRRNQKEKAAKKVRRAKKNLSEVLETVPPSAKAKVQEAIDEYKEAIRREANSLRDDLQLYRTLGTVGTTTAAFAHQAKNPLVQIASSAGTLEESIVENGLFQAETFAEIAAGIRKSAESLLAFAKVTLGLLQHEKRRRGTFSVHASVNEIVSLLAPYIELRQVEVQQELKAKRDMVLASRAALESILTNLLINSLKAFEKRLPGKRLIVIRTNNADERSAKDRPFIQLSVLDNGPGITGLSVEDIWLPGKTTTVEGTGLGLTIVKDVVSELGGRVAAVAHGEFGGAEFLVHLPVHRGG